MTDPTGFAEMTWLNPPPSTRLDSGRLHVVTGDQTDFWRETHYGFVHDTGHFLHHPATGDVCVEVTVAARYEALYDQAGLMMMLDDRHWIKAGIEFAEGQPLFSTVLTRGFSDWAVMPLDFAADTITLRMTRVGDTVQVLVRRPEGNWQMTRLGYLPSGIPARIGVMACSPTRAGFAATFWDYGTGPMGDAA